MTASLTDSANDVSWDVGEVSFPDVSNLVTEDDTPVDNLFSEKQMRLLSGSLQASWKPGFPFVTMSNVGVFGALNSPPIVPDVLVTTHVEPLQDIMVKENRAYFPWKYDSRMPDIVVEIVSNTKGNELDSKQRAYQRLGVTWYAVYDPAHCIQTNDLTVFGLTEGKYLRHNGTQLGETGLSLVLWEGEFEGVRERWLRWQDSEGNLILTGAERAEIETRRAESEAKRAESETKRAEALAQKLRELGIDPDSIS